MGSQQVEVPPTQAREGTFDIFKHVLSEILKENLYFKNQQN